MSAVVTSHREDQRRAHRRRRVRQQVSLALNVFFLVVLAFIVLIPVLWMVQMSFRSAAVQFEMPPDWTHGWTLKNYGDVVRTKFQRNLLNSLIVASLTTVFSLGFGVPAAYALSRYRFRHDMAISFWVLATRMAIPIAFALPLFVLFMTIGQWTGIPLVNTYHGLTLVYLTFSIPTVVWILRPFFDTIPRDLEESAYVDGANLWQTFTRIVLPLAAPGLAAVAILSFVNAWLEFFYALIFTRGPMMTAPVAIVNFLNYAGWEWGKITAGGTVIMLPVIFFSFLTNKYLISGLTAGAVKS
ncbi:MAG: carbohydrate ABC transporter permease [Anaerolineae bacterium]|nr:carbohydrate ABC transporter permease [Anaerolineae bacterium]